MNIDFAPIARIILRYGIGYFVAKGILPEDLVTMITDDPEVMALIDLAVAALIAGAVERWYYLAKKFGWRT